LNLLTVDIVRMSGRRAGDGVVRVVRGFLAGGWSVLGSGGGG
jgi:hypothetical protein